MCGIIGFVGRHGGEKAQDAIIDQFEQQKSRGEKGFGLVTVNKNSYKIRRAVGPVKALIDVSKTPEPILIFHHRFPTSTDNQLDQTHPIEVRLHDLAYDYLIVHNGVISNARKLKEYHMNDLGYVYTTLQKKEPSSYSKYGYAASSYYADNFNDTEAFAIELARYLDGKSDEMDIDGSAAFMGLKVDKQTHKPIDIFWGTNGRNPLVFNETPDGLTIASELEEGYDTEAKTMYMIAIKDIFNAKKKRTPLLDLANTYTLAFKTIPILPITYTPPATTTPPKQESVFKKDIEPKVVGVSDTPPTGYTEREWAHEKMALRQAEAVQDILINFTSDLAALQDYVYDNPNLPPDDELESDLVEDTLNQIEQILHTMVKRSQTINEWVPDDPTHTDSLEADEAAIMKELQEEYIKENADTSTVADVPLSNWLK